MLLHVPGVLQREQLQHCWTKLESATWGDGRATAGYQSARVKNNEQIPEAHPVARELGEIILGALGSAPLFVMAALPFRVFPPLFNRYRGGEAFGTHIDNAIRAVPGGARLRTDLSATLFLSDPAEYDGGELVVEDSFGSHLVKLPPGDMVVYPASSLHHVRPVTRGTRVAAFFWVQSMVRDDGQRTMLFQLDTAIQQLARDAADHPALVQLTGVYHNLIRAWAEL